ncbi:MAG: putative symporter ycgO [Chlamydiota bacterium]|jgi:sodium/proline symporter
MKQELFTLSAYFTILFIFVRLCHKKVRSESEFILGNRSLNFWLTALSAHASDMSAWIFLGYPALVFEGGVFAAWAAIGLTLGMFLSWQFVAPPLRRFTEELKTLTLSSYFEERFQDKSGSLRLLSSLISIFFFTCYVASGLSALGVLSESLLGFSYNAGMLAGLIFIVLYVLWGGYRTVAWIDLFQGFFLLGIILFIPLSLILQSGGIAPILDSVGSKNISTSLIPEYSLSTGWQILMIAAGWGLGYFGQPQILTKFMGIKEPQEIRKAKYLGMSWQILSLGGATLVGLVSIFFFPKGVADSQQVILDLVKLMFSPFVSGLVLCAIVAATTNVMAAHLLIVASHLSEDLYKPFQKTASSKQLLFISRLGVVLIASTAFGISLLKLASVYQIVLYAWSGLGASFGPVVLFSLYSKKISPQVAFTGMLTGALVAAVVPSIPFLNIPPIIPAFLCNSLILYPSALKSRVQNA